MMSTHYLPYTHTHTHTHTHDTQWGGTALRAAIEKEHEDIVELLLEANADPDLPDKVILTYHTFIAVVRHDKPHLLIMKIVRSSVVHDWYKEGLGLFRLMHQDRPLPC